MSNTSPSAISWYTRETVPPGYWRRSYSPTTASTFAGMVTPSYVDTEFGGPFRTERIIVDGYVYSSLSQPPEEPSAEEVAALEKGLRDHQERVVLRRWREILLPALLKEQNRIQALDLQALTDTELLDHIHMLSDHIVEITADHGTNIPAWSLVIGRFALFCQEHLDIEDAKLLSLLTGFSPIIHEPLDRLEALAKEAVSRPALLAALKGESPWSDPAVRELLQPYLAAFGHNGFRVDYTVPSPAEQPERTVQILLEVIDRVEGKQAHSDRAARPREMQFEAEVTALMQRLPDKEKRAEFERRLGEARMAYGVRDEDIILFNSGRTFMRYALLEAGRRLAERGFLVDEQRVFFLFRAEVEKALTGQPAADLLQRAEARWTEHKRQQVMELPPQTFGTKPEASSAPPRHPLPEALQRAQETRNWYFRRVGFMKGAAVDQPAADHARELRGIGASPGEYSGRARVVRALAEFDRIRPGDVLVCSTTRPTWITIFATIGALVTDEGGILSHPAIASREFGIPAVVATRKATQTISEGQIVHVNGETGSVRF